MATSWMTNDSDLLTAASNRFLGSFLGSSSGSTTQETLYPAADLVLADHVLSVRQPVRMENADELTTSSPMMTDTTSG
jgi:hypothetical protein